MLFTSPKLGLPYIAQAQAMKYVTHNEAVERLDVLTQMTVVSFGDTTPPSDPQEGECYGLGTGASGAWAGQDGTLAFYSNGGGWQFLTPQAGWRAWSLSDAHMRVYSASQWLPLDPSFDNVAGLGVNTASDATNRLAVASDASLFTHDGAGHQIKINKADEADTASMLFQSDYTGHAEIGLTGDNDLAFKVSNDGVNFATALKVRNTDGTVEIPSLRSGRIYVLKDTVVDIPTPGDGGMIAVSLINPTYPQTAHSGLFSFDTGTTLSLQALGDGGSMNSMGSTVLSGTTGTSGSSSLSVQPGLLQLENRFAANSYYAYTFLNTY